MADPTITCPNCRTEIKLTESLAAPLVEAARRQFEARISVREAELSKQEDAIRAQQLQIEESRRSLNEQVASQLKLERARLIAEETEKAKRAAAIDIEARDKQLRELTVLLEQREARLGEAQEAQAELIRKERELEDMKRSLGLTVEQRVQEGLENARQQARLEAEASIGVLAKGEIEKAKQTAAAELSAKGEELAEVRRIAQEHEAKLEVAQKEQAEFIRKQRELDDAKREMELNIERQIQKGVASAREKAKIEVEENLKLKLAERDEQISSMNRTIEALKRKSEQGSQQMQGEALEVSLENTLRSNFPLDRIEPVGKGEHGGDLVQHVVGSSGRACGSILWECKRTKNWNDTWLPKLRDDQRAAGSEIAILASTTLPRGVETFTLVEGVWVVDTRYAIPVAMVMRQSLIEIAGARQSAQGHQTKMALVYEYLTSSKFKHRVQAIIERTAELHSDLDREKKSLMKLWAKREMQIHGIMEATVGMYGDLQGIAGQAIQEIEGLELPLIEGAAHEPHVSEIA